MFNSHNRFVKEIHSISPRSIIPFPKLPLEHTANLSLHELQPLSHRKEPLSFLDMMPKSLPENRNHKKQAKRSPSPDYDTQYNKEICKQINEFYRAPQNSKQKIAKLKEEIKNLNNKGIASSMFLSVCKTIKVYLKTYAVLLHKKIGDLGISPKLGTFEEKFSRIIKKRKQSIENKSEDDEEISPKWKNEGLLDNIMIPHFQLKPVYEVPEKYTEFLKYLFDIYKKLCKIIDDGIEEICQLIMINSKARVEGTGFNLHKSMFYECVLKDKLVKVRI